MNGSDPVFAEGLDFSMMTTDELIALKNSILEEIEARVGQTDHAHIVEGTYLVGEDIDAGTYVFFRNSDYEYRSTIKLYTSMDDIKNREYISDDYLSEIDDETRIELTEGIYLVVDGYNGVDIRKAEKIIVPDFTTRSGSFLYAKNQNGRRHRHQRI